MFICVSLNPAVDKRLRLERLRVGNVNRAYEAESAPGGKAAHPRCYGVENSGSGSSLVGLCRRCSEIECPTSAKEIIGAMLNAGTASGAISLGPGGLIWHSVNGDALFAEAPKLSARSCVAVATLRWRDSPLQHSGD